MSDNFKTVSGFGDSSNYQLLLQKYKRSVSNLVGELLKSLLKPSSGKGYFEIPTKGFGNQCWLTVRPSDVCNQSKYVQIKRS